MASKSGWCIMEVGPMVWMGDSRVRRDSCSFMKNCPQQFTHWKMDDYCFVIRLDGGSAPLSFSWTNVLSMALYSTAAIAFYKYRFGLRRLTS